MLEHFSDFVNLSILLRTQNSEIELEKFVGRARQGDEIVVIDHASSDHTVDQATKLGAKVAPYSRESYSYGAALNAGIPWCTHEWVLVASPHFQPNDDTFWERLTHDLRDLPEEVIACQAPIFLTTAKVGHGLTFIGPEDLLATPWHLYGNTCCAYRRTALERFPFNETLLTGEDAEWCVRVVRAGFRVCIDHRIPVLYRNRAPISRYWRRGRTDLPALAEIYGIEIRPNISQIFFGLAKDTGQLMAGRIPLWLWFRLSIKRTAELSLCLG